MIDLYIDFDGVLVDTINETYKQINDLGIRLSDTNNVNKFYRELDWYKTLNDTKEINNAFENIRLLQESGIFNIKILTTVHSIEEIKAKVSFIRSKNPTIPIICVPKGIEKSEIVNPLNSILVDDYGGNLKCWIASGGYGIKFSNTKSEHYLTINSLSELMTSSEIINIINTIIANKGNQIRLSLRQFD